jgi:polyhydroxybutyrate depolymerase
MKPYRIALIILILSIHCRGIRDTKISSENYLTDSIELQGKTRTYYTHLPQNQTNIQNPLPLLLVLHGRYGTGKQIMEHSGFNDLSDKESFIVVYPDGYSRSWADGRGKTPADKEKLNDVEFIEQAVKNVSKRFPINTQKIFVTGHSNGGFMTQRLLLEKSNLFKGGASVAAQISLFVLKKLEPKSPVSVAIFAGTEDPLVPYYGGFVRDGGEILGVDDSIERWREWNGCSLEKTILSKNDFPDETSLDTITYPNCQANTMVRLYRINGAGHQWPGKEQKVPLIKMGRPTKEIDATKEIWNFFSNLK